MRLHLVRHPRPAIADGVCYGRSDLASDRKQQALTLARLVGLLPKNALLFSSPLKRCVELADELASSLGCAAPICDKRLMEMDFGDWEMRAWSDIPRNQVDAWVADLVNYRPGNGENLLQVAQRVRAFRNDLSLLTAEDVIVICHAGTIRLLLADERGLPLADMALHAAQKAHRIDYGEVLIVDC